MSTVARATTFQPFRQRLTPPETRIPEPVQLYCLILMTFVLHIPFANAAVCIKCHTPWPCDQVRLAYRLREGF